MKLLRVAGLALVLAAASTQTGSAWIIPMMGAVHTAAGGTSAGAAAAGGGGAACTAGCVAVGAGVIGGAAILIVGDEAKRIAEGPACATGKMRRSWFGMVKDEAKLWRPYCKKKHKKHKSDPKPKPVTARG